MVVRDGAPVVEFLDSKGKKKIKQASFHARSKARQHKGKAAAPPAPTSKA